jgi:hypothetical protein
MWGGEPKPNALVCGGEVVDCTVVHVARVILPVEVVSKLVQVSSVGSVAVLEELGCHCTEPADYLAKAILTADAYTVVKAVDDGEFGVVFVVGNHRGG